MAEGQVQRRLAAIFAQSSFRTQVVALCVCLSASFGVHGIGSSSCGPKFDGALAPVFHAIKRRAFDPDQKGFFTPLLATSTRWRIPNRVRDTSRIDHGAMTTMSPTAR